MSSTAGEGRPAEASILREIDASLAEAGLAAGTYSPAPYERAAAHEQAVLRDEGWLHATVGPVQTIPAGAALPANLCPVDPRRHLPVARAAPARAAAAERVDVVIPVHLGPRAVIRDLAFTGVRSFATSRLADEAAIQLGEPVRRKEIDDAVRRVVGAYRAEGFVYARAVPLYDESLDGTFVRARIDVVEGPRVVVGALFVRGLSPAVRESVVRSRIALRVGEPYREGDVHRTVEQLLALGMFASVRVSLVDPDTPAALKVAIVEPVEKRRVYLESGVTLASDEGLKVSLDVAHLNLDGAGLSARLGLATSYLPPSFIVDPATRDGVRGLPIGLRRTWTAAGALLVRELGLGPRVTGQLDLSSSNVLRGAYQRRAEALRPTLTWQPSPALRVLFGPSLEHAEHRTFPRDVAEESVVVTSKASFAYDSRRAAAGRIPLFRQAGFHLSASAEWVHPTALGGAARGDFARLTEDIGLAAPLGRGVTFAAQLRLGENLMAPWATHLAGPFPDRLHTLGGADSLRSVPFGALVAQDVADSIAEGTRAESDAPRGGNLLVNPRMELQFPLTDAIDSVAFFDLGNVWSDPSYPFEEGVTMRAGAGAGLRIATPVGVPFVLVFGRNLSPRRWEPDGTLHFSLQVL